MNRYIQGAINNLAGEQVSYHMILLLLKPMRTPGQDEYHVLYDSYIESDPRIFF